MFLLQRHRKRMKKRISSLFCVPSVLNNKLNEVVSYATVQEIKTPVSFSAPLARERPREHRAILDMLARQEAMNGYYY